MVNILRTVAQVIYLWVDNWWVCIEFILRITNIGFDLTSFMYSCGLSPLDRYWNI